MEISQDCVDEASYSRGLEDLNLNKQVVHRLSSSFNGKIDVENSYNVEQSYTVFIDTDVQDDSTTQNDKRRHHFEAEEFSNIKVRIVPGKYGAVNTSVASIDRQNSIGDEDEDIIFESEEEYQDKVQNFRDDFSEYELKRRYQNNPQYTDDEDDDDEDFDDDDDDDDDDSIVFELEEEYPNKVQNTKYDDDDDSIVFELEEEHQNEVQNTKYEDDDEDDSVVFELEDEQNKYKSSSEDNKHNNDDDKEYPVHIPTKVKFNLQPTVHTMIKWNFAYRAARRGPWEEMGRDHCRFQRRIETISRQLNDVLQTQHRNRVFNDRFASTNQWTVS